MVARLYRHRIFRCADCIDHARDHGLAFSDFGIAASRSNNPDRTANPNADRRAGEL